MRERFRQLGMAWRQMRQMDSKLIPLVLLGAFIGVVVALLIGWLLPWSLWWSIPIVIMFAAMGAMAMFNRRIQKAQFSAIEGQPGAAAAVLNQMRGQWFVTPAVAFSSKQDLVHRVVGRCGIVLVGEGSPQRTKGLLAKEKKRLGRVASDTPLHVVIVGDRDGEVPLKKLSWHISKLPRELKKTEVPKVERRLAALGTNVPMPKGIDPTQVPRKRPKPR